MNKDIACSKKRIMKYYVMVILLISLISSCKVKQPVIDVTPEVTGLSDTTDTTGWNEIPVKNYKIYHGSRTRLMDLIHTKLDIHLDWDKQQLNGLASLQLRPYFKSQDKVVLDAKNFDIYQIALIKGTDRIDLNYYYNGLKIFINLDTMYSRTQDIFLEIKYTAKPTEREHQGSRAIESDQGLYFINPDKSEENKPVEVWTQGETESSSCWFPTIDSPNERTTQEMFITVPDRYTTLSNGELVYSKFNGDSTRTDYWKMDLPHAPYLFMLAVGEFQIYKDSWHDIPVTY